MMFKEIGTYNAVINDIRTILFHGQHAPDQENALENKKTYFRNFLQYKI